MKFLKTVDMPDDHATMVRLLGVLQPGQWVRFPHRFRGVGRLFGVSRYAGITKAGTVVMDHSRKHFTTNRQYAKQHS
jgi:hypothetical protein